MKSAPCKDCEKRQVGCHTTCKEYKAWAEIKTAVNRKHQNQADMDRAIKGVRSHRVRARSRKK